MKSRVRVIDLTPRVARTRASFTWALLAGTIFSAPIISYAADVELPDIGKKEEVFIEANNLDYDHEQQIVIAEGSVEILKGATVLFADKIVYDQKQDVVTAVGNVSTIGPDGSAVFTERSVVRGDMKRGIVDYFRAKLSDGSLLAAAAAERKSDDVVILDKAVYSPCPICPGSDTYPQWQIKSDKVVYDKGKQVVEYDDAYFEVYGTPVIYTPYFSHPTPDADRKSGFLTPSGGTDSNLGGIIETPYYWNIAPEMDMTITPMVTTKEGLVLGSEWRHLTAYGAYTLEGSITRPRGFTELGKDDPGDKDIRGHIKGEGKFDLTENWDIGFDGEYASDDTYLRRYNFDNTDMLTSRAYLERVENRDYSIYQTVFFQGLLEEDDQDTIPRALPYFKNHIESRRNIIGGLKGSKIWTDISGFMLNRDEGAENQRLSVTGGALIPYVTDGGNIFELAGTLRGDQYHLDNASADDNNQSRFIPEASLGWRYPLINELENGDKILLQPVTKLIVSPDNDYNLDIPNEDSQDVEFSDLNVFHNNRFRGLDRVESGTRVYYGLRGGYYAQKFDVNYVVGQNYQVSEPKSLPANTGIQDNFSDVVGRVSTTFYDMVDLSYKFRFDKENMKSRRNEIDLGVTYDPVKLNLTYFFLDYDYTNVDDNREEITGLAQVRVHDNWSILAGGRRNLAEEQNIEATTGVLYEGDCTNILATIEREFVSDRDAKSGTSFNIQLGLKNLGEF